MARHGGHEKQLDGHVRFLEDWDDYQDKSWYQHRGVSSEPYARSAFEYYGRSRSSSRDRMHPFHHLEGKRNRYSSNSKIGLRPHYVQQKQVESYRGNHTVLERTDEFYEREFSRLQRSQLQNGDQQLHNIAGSGLKNFVTFYFTNISALIPYHILRQSFEVCGILEDLFVARKFNAQGKAYGFVRYGNVKNVEKLTKALNDVTFGTFRVFATVARFDRHVKDLERRGLVEKGLCEGENIVGGGGGGVINEMMGEHKKW